MAKRGPKPKPAKILNIRGSWRANICPPDEKVVDSHQKPPNMPSWLSKEAKKEWHRIIKITKSQGIITEINRNIFAAYCESWADYLEAHEYCRNMKKDGESSIISKTALGNVIQNPAIGIRNTALKMMLKIAAELGITSIIKIRAKEAIPKEKRKDRFFKKSS